VAEIKTGHVLPIEAESTEKKKRGKIRTLFLAVYNRFERGVLARYSGLRVYLGKGRKKGSFYVALKCHSPKIINQHQAIEIGGGGREGKKNGRIRTTVASDFHTTMEERFKAIVEGLLRSKKKEKKGKRVTGISDAENGRKRTSLLYAEKGLKRTRKTTVYQLGEGKRRSTLRIYLESIWHIFAEERKKPLVPKRRKERSVLPQIKLKTAQHSRSGWKKRMWVWRGG